MQTLAAGSALTLVPQLAKADTKDSDPIFAAIEAHKRAAIETHRKGMPYWSSMDGTPEHEAAEAEYFDAEEAEDEAAVQLLDVRPTTMAGVIALLRYVADFDQQKITDGSWWSEQHQWPYELSDDDLIGAKTGKVLLLPFHALLLRNVQAAIEEIAGGMKSVFA